MSDVLVLNASYEPLSRVSWDRAIRLVIKGKAVIEEAIEGRFIRHEHGEFPFPKILRLLHYVNVPFKFQEAPFTKSGVLRRDNHKCAYCGKGATTIDHILPQVTHPELSREWTNVISACFPCNNKKGHKTLKEAGMRLLFDPWVPMQFTRLRGVERKQAMRK